MTPAVVLNRILAAGLLVLLLVLIFLVTVLPVQQSYRAKQAAIADRTEQLEQALGVAASAEQLSQQHSMLRSQGGLSRYLIEGVSVPLAAAALQRRIEVAVGRREGQLISTEVLRPVDEHGLTRVSLRARLRLDTPALQQILHELESGLPFLVIDNAVAASLGEGQDPSVPVALEVELRIVGWIRSSGGGA